MHPVDRQTLSQPGPARTGRARRSWRRTRARLRLVRATVRRTRAGRVGWRVAVGLVGGLVLVVGVIAIPGPGQGWAIVFLGLAILSTEFSWAQRLRHALVEQLRRGRRYYASRPAPARALLFTGFVVVLVAALLGAMWLSLLLTGLPGWLPDPVTDLLTRVPGVD